MAKKTEKRHAFIIPVGDWSGDGHSKCEYVHADAAKPFKAVCQAFAAAKKKFKDEGSDFTPEDLCSEYQDNEIPAETVELLKEHGYKINPDNFYVDEMTDLVIWYLNQGDSDLDAKVLSGKKKIPTLRNWDYCDAMKVGTASAEGLGSFGYGLLGD